MPSPCPSPTLFAAATRPRGGSALHAAAAAECRLQRKLPRAWNGTLNCKCRVPTTHAQHATGGCGGRSQRSVGAAFVCTPLMRGEVRPRSSDCQPGTDLGELAPSPPAPAVAAGSGRLQPAGRARRRAHRQGPPATEAPAPLMGTAGDQATEPWAEGLSIGTAPTGGAQLESCSCGASMRSCAWFVNSQRRNCFTIPASRACWEAGERARGASPPCLQTSAGLACGRPPRNCNGGAVRRAGDDDCKCVALMRLLRREGSRAGARVSWTAARALVGSPFGIYHFDCRHRRA